MDVLEGFSPTVFSRRREKLLAALAAECMVLPAAPLRYKSGDSEYAYRPDSDLFYVTGLIEPGAVAVLRGFADESRFVLFVRDRDPEEERWSGRRLGLGEASEALGADEVHSISELDRRLPDLLAGGSLLHFRLGTHPELQRLVEKTLARARIRGARSGAGPRGVMDPSELLAPLRRIKDDEEIQALRRACAATVQGFERALAATAPGQTEGAIQGVLEAGFLAAGARRPSFATIVASGPNACVLHYQENRRSMQEGDLVLMDAGAEVSLYCGDVTRTVPASGRFSAEQRALYDVVARAREEAVRVVAPGVPVTRIQEVAVQTLVEGMVELGILKGGVEALIEQKAHAPYYPHQTSHWLGLDVHDVGDYVRDGEPVSLEPGMVIAVEPGLYFPEGADGAAAPFAGMGIRVEDDVLVTPEGSDVLTGGLPTAADALEDMLAVDRSPALP